MSAKQLRTHLVPRDCRRGIGAMLGETPIQFSRQFWRNGYGHIRGFVCDRVPEILDELKTLRHGKRTKLLEIKGAFSHDCNLTHRHCLSKRCRAPSATDVQSGEKLRTSSPAMSSPSRCSYLAPNRSIPMMRPPRVTTLPTQ